MLLLISGPSQIKKMNNSWGIRMEGVGEQLTPFIIDYIKDKKEFTYLEIGVASCRTFRAIYDIIKENIGHDIWLCLGLDLPYSGDVNWAEINNIFTKEELFVNHQNNDEEVQKLLDSKKCHAILVLRENPREWSRNMKDRFLDLVLIDGNHNHQNVSNDFLSIEDKVKVGGYVLFHDFSEIEQGTDPQNGGGFIEVKQACFDLGLLTNGRPNWKFITEFKGTRKSKDDFGGNGLGIFQRI
jgi:hypothetical protein